MEWGLQSPGEGVGLALRLGRPPRVDSESNLSRGWWGRVKEMELVVARARKLGGRRGRARKFVVVAGWSLAA